MGGDGQALANKRSLLQKSRVYVTAADLESGQAKEKTSQKSRTVERWSHCALSLQPLEAPAVFDGAGDIFSKQSVVNYLLDRKERSNGAVGEREDKFCIKKLTDVKEIANEIDVECPFCGLESFYVRLICEDAEDAENQQTFLRHYIKRSRKRVRDDDAD